MFSAICFLLSAFFWALAIQYFRQYRALKREEAKHK